MAYDSTEWHDFFVLVGGAAAALAGLLFVAISINIDQILRYSALPIRASETLAALLAMLLVSVFGLVPDQPRALLAGELILISAFQLLIIVRGGLGLRESSRRGNSGTSESSGREKPEPRSHHGTAMVLTVAVAVPWAVAGVTLLFGVGGGLYWIVPAFVLGFTTAIANGWVLLVEILR